MSKFSFLGTRAQAAPGPRAAAQPTTASRLGAVVPGHAAAASPFNPVDGLVWSKDVVTRLSDLRLRIHRHLLAVSRDYSILTSIRSSKIEYCETVTRELTKRLSANPFYEVLQQLDAAQAQMSKTVGSGR